MASTTAAFPLAGTPDLSVPLYRNNTLKRFLSRVSYLGALIRQRVSGRDYPIAATLVVTNRCNWNCVYCFGDYPNRRETDYTTAELLHIVDELHRLGVRYLTVHGGEALLRDDIAEVCSYIKRKGICVSLVTNGSFLAKKIESLRSVDNLTFSLDGNREGNDGNRGKNTFEATTQAIALAKKYRIPVRIQATLTRSSMNDVSFLAHFAKENKLHLQFSILFKPLKQAKHLQMTPLEVRTALNAVLEFKKKGFPIFTSSAALRAAYEWPYDYGEHHHIEEKQIPASYRKHHVPCYFGRTNFTVEADGNIYPCFLTTDGSFKPKSWRTVGVEQAILNVVQNDTCRACPTLTHNDHNLLLGFDLGQVLNLAKGQLREIRSVLSRT